MFDPHDDGGTNPAAGRRDKWGRRIALLLFVAVVFLAGLYIGTSFYTVRPTHRPIAGAPAPAASEGRERGSPEAVVPQPPSAPKAELDAAAAPTVAERVVGPAAAKLTSSEIEDLRARGDARLRSGDVTAARALYQACAIAGDGTAALRLGQTFDPAFLRRSGLRGVPGDLGQAAYWYRRGQELGNGEAAFLLRETEIDARTRWNAGAPAHRPRRSPASE